MKPIIAPSELLSLQPSKNLVLIDARSGGDAKEKYLAEHLKGAFWVDLEQDLAHKSNDPANGGRHPLPSPQQFNRLLAQLGIAHESHVVVYDDKNGANAAARFWWMAKSIGQERVQVLDGGIAAAAGAGYPTGHGTEAPAVVERVQTDAWIWPTANIDEVGAAAGDARFVVIDVREKDRYDGLREPIDLVAGHVPGAINVPFSDNLDETGRFLSPEALRSKYGAAIGDRDSAHVVVHCGSGVTACHTLLAMAHAGMEIPKLYVGSWSEWSRSGRKIARMIE